MPFSEGFPFRRVAVDHRIEGVSRIWWQLHPSFSDNSLGTYQLQAGRTGLTTATDWVDVGDAAVGAWYLEDDERRLHGKRLLTHYRVKLTTEQGTYMSRPVGVYGQLPEEDWITAREIIRKEQLRLGKVGVEGVLLKRLRHGSPCPRCLDQMTEQVMDSKCPECFSPDALIRTATGFKRIADIVPGEQVLTIDGSFRRVIKTMVRDYTGKAYRIRTASMTSAMIVTPEHPIHAMASTHVFADCEQIRTHGNIVCAPSPCDGFIRRVLAARCRPTGVSFHAKTGKWRAKTQVSHYGVAAITLGYFPTKAEAQQVVDAYREQHFDIRHRLDWIPAEKLGERHWIDTIYPCAEQDLEFIDAPICPVKGRTRVHKRRGTSRFAVNEEFLWVVGMYIAEGSASHRSLCFALHCKETNYRDRLVKFFTDHGFRATVTYPKGQAMVVHVYGTTLAEWFPQWLGRGSHNKHIPEEFMRLPPHKAWALIQGIWDGDGNKNANEIGQTSELLALQLIELLHRLGKQPTVYRGKPRPGKKQVWGTSWEEPTFNKYNRKSRWHFDNRLLSKIVEFDEINYAGPVHNLEVEGNHTYVVQNSVVHNCHGVGFKVGYHPPMPLVCWDLSPQPVLEKRSGAQPPGQSREVEIQARTLACPDLALEDVWVNADSDERWAVDWFRHVAAIRGVPLVFEVGLRLLPYSHVVYRLAIGGEGNDHALTTLPTTGNGCVTVDHDYGGEDALAYNAPEGCGVIGATVLAIPKTDYDNGLRTAAHAVAATTTTANGRWEFALKLNAGEYVLVFEKAGEYGPDAHNLTVTGTSDSSSSSSVSESDFGPI